jgi:hypothetical protein
MSKEEFQVVLTLLPTFGKFRMKIAGLPPKFPVSCGNCLPLPKKGQSMTGSFRYCMANLRHAALQKSTLPSISAG